MFKHRRFFAALSIVLIIAAVFCTNAVAGDKNAPVLYSEHPVSDDVKNIDFYKPSANTQSYKNITCRSVKNVIFFIGDGMSIGQVAVTRLKAAGFTGKLYMERMPIVGLAYTNAANAIVTDSAAAGTALACGVKTNNGMIGMTPDKTSWQSILTAAAKKGMKTGLVATSTITHATPASFGSHVESRGMEAEIAVQLLASRANVILGGGKKFWIPQSTPGSERKDDLDLLTQAGREGYTIANNSTQLAAIRGPWVLGLFQQGPLTTISPEPTLAEMTHNAIRLLSEKPKRLFEPYKGFFLMVEGSQIDWAGHANDVHNNIKQTLLFDKAIMVAIDFAMRDKNTLIVITADHETGGLVLKGDDLDNAEHVGWASGGHTATPVPVYAYGPHSRIFTGVYDNTDIPKKIAKLLKIKYFPKKLKK